MEGSRNNFGRTGSGYRRVRDWQNASSAEAKEQTDTHPGIEQH